MHQRGPPGRPDPPAPPGRPRSTRAAGSSRAGHRCRAARRRRRIRDAADRALEAVGQRAARLLRHRSDSRPAGLRLPHVLVRGAEPAVVVDLAADRVRGQRFLQHRRQPRRRRQRRVAGRGAGPLSDSARSSIRRTSASIRLRLASGSRSRAAEDGGPVREDAA